jgi:hypothetical protein
VVYQDNAMSAQIRGRMWLQSTVRFTNQEP